MAHGVVDSSVECNGPADDRAAALEGRTKALPVAQMAAATTGKRSFMVAEEQKNDVASGRGSRSASENGHVRTYVFVKYVLLCSFSSHLAPRRP